MKESNPPTPKAVKAAKTILWSHYLATETAMAKAVGKAKTPEAKIEAARKWAREWLWEICGYAEHLAGDLRDLELEDIPGPMLGGSPCMNTIEEVEECLERFHEEADAILAGLEAADEA